jgi:multidrug transporter EmrE-like cation transporter
MKLLLAISPTIILMVYAQLVTKWRVESLFDARTGAPGGMSRLMSYLADPYVLSAYVAALAGSMAWMFVVERNAISIAFPVYIGLTVAIVAIGGVALFGEPMTAPRLVSIVLILAGVAIGSRA